MRTKIAILVIIAIQLLFITDAVSAITDNSIKAEDVISITDIIKPHILNNSKDVSLKDDHIYVEPVWSPDGGKIIIRSVIEWSQSEGISGIYVMNADGSDLNRIVSVKKMDSRGTWIAEPTWSPRGDKISFILTVPGALLAIINPDGTELKAIATNFSDMDSILSFIPDAEWYQNDLKWSPDGTKIAFRFSKKSTGVEHIFVAGADGSNPEKLYSDVQNSGHKWSHNSKKIIFDMRGEESNLVIMYIDEGNLKYLSNGTKYRDYEFSPDDSKIVYIRAMEIEGEEYFELNIINANGTGQKKIIGGSWIEQGPTWSPDGSKVLFQQFEYENNEENINVYTVDKNGENLTLIISGNIKMLSLSPDGEKIAFVENQSSYTMNLDGTGKTMLALTTWGTILGKPAYLWSPSGDKIIFSSVINPSTGKQTDFDWAKRDSHESHVFISNPSGAERVQLTASGKSHIIGGSWSPDGSRVIVASLAKNMQPNNTSIIKLGGHDKVMSINVPLFIEPSENFVIEVKSMSKPVENASISLRDKEIGVTSEKGYLKYSIKEPGKYLLNATKDGYKTTVKTIIIDESKNRFETKAEATITSPAVTSNTSETPGFTLIASVSGLLASLVYSFKRRRRVL